MCIRDSTRTLRSVVDWRGQVVTLLDRCYLAEAVPTLIVWGDRDGVIPVAHARRVHAAMAGSRLEVFAGAGHFPHHDDHDRFVDLLRGFVATTAPAAHDAECFHERLRRGAADTVAETEAAAAAGSVAALPVPAGGVVAAAS